MHGMEKEDRERFFCLSQDIRTWGHLVKWNVGIFRAGKMKGSPSHNHIVKRVNLLTHEVVVGTNLDALKIGVNKLMGEKATYGY